MVDIFLDEKAIRAGIIKRYLGNQRCFAFSCGNATEALKAKGVNVLPISKLDAINATRYVTPLEAQQLFDCFDATPGNLPVYMIRNIADEIKATLPKKLFKNYEDIYVPTGSGETLFALSFIFPITRLKAVIDIEDENSPIFFYPGFSPLFDFVNENFEIVTMDDITPKTPGYFISKGREHYKQNK